jgi:hypothetical protein
LALAHHAALNSCSELSSKYLAGLSKEPVPPAELLQPGLRRAGNIVFVARRAEGRAPCSGCTMIHEVLRLTPPPVRANPLSWRCGKLRRRAAGRQLHRPNGHLTNVPTPKITRDAGTVRNPAQWSVLRSSVHVLRLHQAGCTTLVTHGEADWIVSIQAAGHRTAKLVKGANLAAIKDGTHPRPALAAGVHKRQSVR